MSRFHLVLWSAVLTVLLGGMLCIRPLLAQNAILRQTSLNVIKALEQSEKDKYWLSARETVYRSFPDILAQHLGEKANGIKYHKLLHGNTKQKYIALTFDDGPHPAFTPQILAILKTYDVKATFFVVGQRAEQAPQLIRAEIADGNDVGNHTYHHVNLTMIPPAYVATEIKACGEVLENITGHAPHLLRPPGGDYSNSVAQVSDALGYTMVLWTDDPGDYTSPGKQVIMTRVLATIHNGGIILLHDGIHQTIDVLPNLITTLRAKGYQFVTVDELMQHRAHATKAPVKPEAFAPKLPVKPAAPALKMPVKPAVPTLQTPVKPAATTPQPINTPNLPDNMMGK